MRWKPKNAAGPAYELERSSKFQDKKIEYEVSFVSGVLNFTSAYHRTLRTTKNAAELAEVSQLAVDESSESMNFSYGKRKKRAISMSPA